MFKNTSLKDFKVLANTLEKEYKQQGNIAKLYSTLFNMCKSSNHDECKVDAQYAQVILTQIWETSHNSKQNVLDAIVTEHDELQPSKPLHVTKEYADGLKIINDMNHQHDLYATKLNGNNKQSVQQLYSKSKQLGKDVDKNYNEYFKIWNIMKDLEQKYIEKYDKYNEYKLLYKNKSIPQDVIKQLDDIYNNLTNNIIPEFKKLNEKLDVIVAQRKELLDKFYTLYLSLSIQERQGVNIPLTSFDIHRKLYSKSVKSDKPKVKVNKCIKKSWIDATKEGFNPSFYAPCHILKQNTVITNCSSAHDWPYIEYEPNLFTAWDAQYKYSEWINSCIHVEHIRRPFIGI